MSWKKLFLVAALVGAFAFVSAPKSDAGVHVGIGIGLPLAYPAYPYPYYPYPYAYGYGYPDGYYGPYGYPVVYGGGFVHAHPVVVSHGHRFVRHPRPHPH
jgi:hypothetical protein